MASVSRHPVNPAWRTAMVLFRIGAVPGGAPWSIWSA